MNIKIISVIILTISILCACNVQEACEINNTGQICVTNELDIEIEMFVNETRVLTIQPGETGCVTKHVDSYSVRCFSATHQWTFDDVSVKQCEKTNLSISEILWED